MDKSEVSEAKALKKAREAEQRAKKAQFKAKQAALLQQEEEAKLAIEKEKKRKEHEEYLVSLELIKASREAAERTALALKAAKEQAAKEKEENTIKRRPQNNNTYNNPSHYDGMGNPLSTMEIAMGRAGITDWGT